jgi:hypothetical protein
MAKDQSGVIPIQDFNQGGLSSSKWSGKKNSVYKMIGFDPHSLPGILLVEQKMTAETTGTEPTELCKVAVNCSDGSQYWFSSDSGKIWERPTSGTWRLVHTTTPAAGEAKCLGAAEYQGYIYWATQSRLHRITVANANTNDWVTDAVEDWATFTNTDISFHPMYSHPSQQILYIGDANYVAQVDAGTFSAKALDIKTPLRIKSLGQIGTDLLLGTYVADTVTKTEIIRWNGWSVSFTNSDPIPEIGINAFLQADNFVLVQAGNKGNIYYYNGQQLELYGRIPGNYSSTAYGEVYPYSVANKEGQILFGFSNGSGDPADQLIYRISRHDKDYPYIMDQPYPISVRSGTDFVLTGLSLGAILVVGSDIYVSWKSGSTYGVDKSDASNKLNGAYLETRIMSINREEFANLSKIIVSYASLPASTDIDMYTDRNYAGYGSALAKVDDTDRKIISTKDEQVDFTTLQLKIKATTSVNDAPQIESAGVFVP